MVYNAKKLSWPFEIIPFMILLVFQIEYLDFVFLFHNLEVKIYGTLKENDYNSSLACLRNISYPSFFVEYIC